MQVYFSVQVFDYQHYSRDIWEQYAISIKP